MAKATFTATQKIKVLVTTNPKTKGTDSYKRFAKYLTKKAPKTVADALKAGITRADIRWDIDHGFIAVA